jgi:hypothetical protein
MISEADLKARFGALSEERVQRLAQLNAIEGALMEVQYWLRKIKEDANPTEE